MKSKTLISLVILISVLILSKTAVAQKQDITQKKQDITLHCPDSFTINEGCVGLGLVNCFTATHELHLEQKIKMSGGNTSKEFYLEYNFHFPNNIPQEMVFNLSKAQAKPSYGKDNVAFCVYQATLRSATLSKARPQAQSKEIFTLENPKTTVEIAVKHRAGTIKSYISNYIANCTAKNRELRCPLPE